MRKYLPGSAGNNRIQQRSGTTPPPQAAAAGYTTLDFSNDFDMVPTFRAETVSATGDWSNYYWYGFPGFVSAHEDGGSGKNVVVSTSWSGDNLTSASSSILTMTANTVTAGASYPSATKYGTKTGIGAMLQTSPNYNDINNVPILYNSGKTWQYGYFEARMKGPTTAYYWPSFWLFGEANREIDIVELQTALPTQVYQSTHAPATGHDNRSTTTLPASGVVSDFHVYGLLWTAGQIQFYVDNVLTGTYSNVDFAVPMWLILSIGIGDFFGVSPSVYPASAQVDWVRVWQ